MDWYVVATKPHGELHAQTNLIKQGYTVFVPLIKKNRRHARRVDTVLRPLFPGYLFVQFNLKNTAWRSINGTIGVRYLLNNNGQPQCIQSSFIETLLGAIDENGAVTHPKPIFAKGEVVEIMTGALQGHLATILSANEKSRVRILLSIMGGEVISSISLEDIDKAS